jgi:hypothetical protein
MFNRVIFAAEARHGPRNQSNGSPPDGVIHIGYPNVNFQKFQHAQISCSLWHTSQDVLVSHPVPHGQTMYADYYKFLLLYHPCRTVTRPEILYTAISLHDNATAPLVNTLKDFLAGDGTICNNIYTLPTSIRVIPCVCDLIPTLKQPLG